MEVTIDLTHCKIIVLPKMKRVVFISKWSGESQNYNIEQFITILETISLTRK